MKGDQLAHLMPGAAEGHIVGWRLWFLRSGGCLQSIIVDVPWKPGRPVTSSNLSEQVWFGLIPQLGVFAFKQPRPAHLLDDVAAPCTIGEVALWGRIAEHRHGYRAQYAYPLSLRLKAGFEPLIKEAASRYGLRLLEHRARSRLDRLEAKARQFLIIRRQPPLRPLLTDLPSSGLHRALTQVAKAAEPGNNS